MSLDTPQIKELIKKARDNNDVVLFKNQLPNVLKWENFIDILNYKYHSLNQQNSKQEPGNRLLENNNRITDILIYNNLDMHVFDILGYNKKWYDEFLKILNNSFNIDFPGSKNMEFILMITMFFYGTVLAQYLGIFTVVIPNIRPM